MQTAKDYLDAGYHVVDKTYQRGYVSRKTDIDNQPVMFASGNRKGQPYFLVPCWHSTQYCVRCYLSKEV